jgi:hypothetical protein
MRNKQLQLEQREAKFESIQEERLEWLRSERAEIERISKEVKEREDRLKAAEFELMMKER